MTGVKAPNQMSGSLSDIKAAIVSGVSSIKTAVADRKACNADISAVVEQLESKGVHRRALKMAMAYAEWDADTRAGFDTAYSVVREALGCPFEDTLFDAEGKPNAKIKGAQKDAKSVTDQSALN